MHTLLLICRWSIIVFTFFALPNLCQYLIRKTVITTIFTTRNRFSIKRTMLACTKSCQFFSIIAIVWPAFSAQLALSSGIGSTWIALAIYGQFMAISTLNHFTFSPRLVCKRIILAVFARAISLQNRSRIAIISGTYFTTGQSPFKIITHLTVTLFIQDLSSLVLVVAIIVYALFSSRIGPRVKRAIDAACSNNFLVIFTDDGFADAWS